MLTTDGYTPLFNKENFMEMLEQYIAVDKKNHMRILETILPPQIEVEIISSNGNISHIKTAEYIYSDDLFTCAKFLKKGRVIQNKMLPSKEKIISHLLNFPKLPYLLGGACIQSIELGIASSGCQFKGRHKTLFGIDCSGLLYFVSNGFTPRNTCDLFNFGRRVEDLKPLDIILYPGHVLIYIGKDRVIESREIDGVIISDWRQRKKMIDKKYHFIRWYPSSSL